MLSEKNLAELNLTEDQMKKYRNFEQRERMFRSILKKCGVHHSAIDKIILKSDLNKIDMNNLEALEEDVKDTWSDFIVKKGE